MLPLSSGYHRPTHLQVRPNQLLKRETERLFEGIMIDHEQLNPSKGEKVYWLTRANCRRQRSMEILDEKVNAHLPYCSTLKKFWNGFFQTFQAGLLFFSGQSVRWRSLTLLSPHRESVKSKGFLYKGWTLRFFLDLHRDMQVIPDSEASIVLFLFKKKITRWCSWRLN